MEVKCILWGIFYQKCNVKFMIQDKLHWLNSTRGFKRSALCKPGGPLSVRCFRIRRSQCEMCRWNVCSLRIGELVAKKGRSLGGSCPITLAVWQIRMGVERIYADFRNARKTAQSAMTRKNKEIHLGFICMSIPIILCQFTFWKRWRDLFFKKKKRLEWFGMMVGAADSFLCPWVFTARKSWPMPIAKGLPSHIVVKLREKISRIVPYVQLAQNFENRNPGLYMRGQGK